MSVLEITRELQALDIDMAILVSSGTCVWARTHLGVVGCIEIVATDQGAIKTACLKQMEHAYHLLDSIPESDLPLEDMWNTTLLLQLPWSEDDARRRPEAYSHLIALERDTMGARKLLLWKDQSLDSHFGPFGIGHGANDVVAAADPLGEEIRRLAKDEIELGALRILFKGKLNEDDIEALIAALSREAAE